MANEDDPKHVAQEARKTPATEKILRQFLRLESTVDVKKFNANYDTSFKEPKLFEGEEGVKCASCPYEARSEAEMCWHEKQAGHFSWLINFWRAG